MTINLADNDPRVSYAVAAGVTQSSFTVSFEFFTDADLNVYVDGTLKTLTTDYTVTGGSGSTGSIAMSVTGASGGSTVVITRSIALERTTDFPSSGPFDISSLNEELDKFISIAGDLKDKSDRALQLTDFDTDVSLTLPDVNTRKGKLLAFNATSGAVEAGASTTGATTVAALATDIETLADIEDGTVATDAISDTAAIASDVSTVAGISSNVTTVASISSDVTAVAADATDIGTVATNIADVNTVATNIADVVTVANDLNEAISEIETAADDLNEAVSEIDTVATNIANVNKVGAIDTNVTTVAGIDSDVTTVAGISANVTTVAGINSDVTTVSGISADVTTVAADVSDIGTVAGISSDVSTVSGISANVTTVAGISSDVSAVGAVAANVTTVANNLTDINNFADTYFIGATAPSSPTEGDLWFDTTNDIMKVYDGSGFINAGSSVNGTSERSTYTAASGQDTFAATYDAGYVDVYLNGIKLIDGTDFTATDGANVVLTSGAALNDTVDIVGYGTFDVAIPNISNDTTPQLGGDLDTNGNDVNFGDNDKAQFGAGNDLQIYHDGANSYIQDKGTGDLFVDGDNNLTFRTGDGLQTKAKFTTLGAVELYHSNSKKLETTSTGVDVTGKLQGGGTALQYDSGLVARASTHATSRRASIDFGGWTVGQDAGANGTKDFFFYDGVASAHRMNIDTSGRVTLSNQPYFLAKPNAAYTPSQGSGHELSATNVITNRGSIYNSSNSRFTAPVSGIYSITYGLTWYPASNGTYNGSYFTVSSGGSYYFFAPSGSDVNNLITADLELSANDYVTFYTYSGHASNGVQANSYISAYLLG
jgi:hypothetical protein